MKTRKTNTRKHISKKRLSVRRKRIIIGGKSEEFKIKDKYRSEFKSYINQFKKYFENKKVTREIDSLIEKWIKWFEINKENINTKIPIKSDRTPTIKTAEEPDVYDFVSPITVILENINVGYVGKTKIENILNKILELGGDINLESSKTKETPASREVKKGNSMWLSYLKGKGAHYEEPVRDIPVLSPRSESIAKSTKKPENRKTKKNKPSITSLPLVPPPVSIRPSVLDVSPSPVTPPLEEQTQTPVVEQLPPIPPPVERITTPPVEQLPPIPPPPTERITTPPVEQVLPPTPPSQSSIVAISPYDLNRIPPYWNSLFPGNELFDLRFKIQAMTNFSSDGRYSDICRVVKSIVPGYNIDNPNKPIIARNITLYKTELDHQNCNALLCAIFLLLGILSFKLQNHEYNFIFKGGKAIQLLLSTMNYSEGIYSSDDIDVLIMPNRGVYDMENMRVFAAHIGYLIQWILNNTNQTINISIKIPDPNNPSDNPYVTKISYKNHNAPRGFTALSDIDTKPIPDFLSHYYQNPNNYLSIVIPLNGYGLNQTVMYKTLSIEPLLDEKIYYFILYYNTLLQKKEGIEIEDESLRNISPELLEIFLDKFQRAIYALTRAIAVTTYYSEMNKTRSKQNINPEQEYIALQGKILHQHSLIQNIKPVIEKIDPRIYRIQIVKRLMKIA